MQKSPLQVKMKANYTKLVEVEKGGSAESGGPAPPSGPAAPTALRPSPALLTCLLFFIYLLLCDVFLVARVRGRAANWHQETTPGSPDIRSITGFSVKAMTEDSSVIHIFDPLSAAMEHVTDLTSQWPWLTANMVTFTHLALGLFASWLISRMSACLHRLAAAIFLFRSLLDAYDGLVARVRLSEAISAITKSHAATHSNFGYYLDGLADGAATTTFLFGVLVFYWKCPPKLQSLVNCKLQLGRISIPLAPPIGCTQFSTFTQNKQIFLIVFNFGMQVISNSVLWNNFILTYSEVLDSPYSSLDQLKGRLVIISSFGTQLIFFAWRMVNLLFLGMTSFALITFFGLSWEYMCVLRWSGWVTLLVLAFCTKLHLLLIGSWLHHR